MLGQVVVDDQRVLAVIEEVLTHGAAGVGGHELDRRRLVGRGGHDDRVVERVVLAERLRHLHDRRHPLADRDVDADQVLVAVVDDRVDRHRGLAGLAVADDQLALTAADRGHGVDRLDAGQHRLLHRLALDHAGGLELGRAELVGGDLALAVQRRAERGDDAAEHLVADGDLEQALGALDRVALDDLLPRAEEHGADVVGFEVEREARHVVGQLEHLHRHAVVEAVDARDPVPDREHRADLREVRPALVQPLDAALEDARDLVGLDLHCHWRVDSSLGSSGHFSSEAIQTGPHGAVHHHVPDPHRESAEHVGIDLGGQLGTPAGLLLDLLPDPADRLVVELDRAGDRNRKQPVLLGPEAVELSPDAEHDRHAVPFGEHLEEADEPLVGPRDQPRYGVLLLLGAEVRREEEDLEVPVLVERVGELPELLVDLVLDVVLLRNLEERARVDLGDLLHYSPPPFVCSPASWAKSNSSSASSMRRR